MQLLAKINLLKQLILKQTTTMHHFRIYLLFNIKDVTLKSAK